MVNMHLGGVFYSFCSGLKSTQMYCQIFLKFITANSLIICTGPIFKRCENVRLRIVESDMMRI